MYQYEEALKTSKEYFEGDDLAAKVFVDKYALRDNEGNLLEKSPEDMHWRIAKEIHRIESGKYKKPMSVEEIFSYLDRFKRIIPQGSPMYGIGNPYQYISLSNCFVVCSPEDSFGGIHRTDEQLSQISKRRGGVGLDLSKLRPAGTPTQNSSRTSTGVIPFMERFSNSIREVGQAGRRGALMQSISIHHPEVLEFAKVKNDKTKVTGANISIRLSDEFLNAVQENTDYEQRFPVDSKTPSFSRMVSARAVWREIIEQAHAMAEPGLLFWDNIIKESPADCYKDFETISTNPCSELPLSVLDSCRLLLLNLFSYVKKPFTAKASFDYESFYNDAIIAQRFMDDFIDLETEAIDRIINKIKSDPESMDLKRVEIDMWKQVRKACTNGRRTGTGITALGDTIAALGVRYGSEDSIEITEKIYRTLKLGCYRSSVDMAKELGPFPVWDHELEKNNQFLLRIKEDDPQLWADMKKWGRRNISLLTTAPAGTVSIESQTSSGIEPVFMLFYTRRKKINHDDPNARVDFVDQNGDKWQEFTVYHPKYKLWMAISGKEAVQDSPYFGATAEEIDWVNRVKLQAAAQRHVDHSISSTINLPEDISVDTVATIYETSWKTGLKGITVYRKNCRTGVLVDKKAEEKKKPSAIQKTVAPIRPKQLSCDVHHVTVKGQEYFVMVGLLEDEPYEVFAGLNGHIKKAIKTGSLTKLKRGLYRAELETGDVLDSVTEWCNEDEEALTRMTSTALRHGADISFVVHQLEKVGGPMTSFAKALARSLKKYVPDGTKVHGETCQTCSSQNIVRQEGCLTCLSCGWSKCS